MICAHSQKTEKLNNSKVFGGKFIKGSKEYSQNRVSLPMPK